MFFLSNKVLIRVLKAALTLTCLFMTIAVGQSCRDKPTDESGKRPDRPPWNQSEVDLSASWSPDGSRIIYTRDPADGARDTSWQFGAFIHNLSTGRDSCLWPNVKFDGFSWSPDSKRLAVIQEGQIYIYDFAIDSLRQITNRNRSFSVSWSPCGDKLVFFDRFNYVGMQVYDIALDSVFNIAGEDQARSGDWMPDCSTVVVMDSCRFTDCGLYGYNIYTDSLWLLSGMLGYKGDLAVSPDGKTVVFVADYDLWVVDIITGQLKRLTTEGGGYPDWSPDGQWIVFTKENPWDGYLWLMRPDGSEKHQITF